MSIDATTWAWQQEKLRPAQKLLLLSLADRAGEQHDAAPSLSRLQADTGLCRETIIESLRDLETQGLIKIVRQQGAPSIYRLIGVKSRHQTSTTFPTGRKNQTTPTSTTFPTGTENQTTFPDWSEGTSTTFPTTPTSTTFPTGTENQSTFSDWFTNHSNEERSKDVKTKTLHHTPHHTDTTSKACVMKNVVWPEWITEQQKSQIADNLAKLPSDDDAQTVIDILDEAKRAGQIRASITGFLAALVSRCLQGSLDTSHAEAARKRRQVAATVRRAAEPTTADVLHIHQLMRQKAQKTQEQTRAARH